MTVKYIYCPQCSHELKSSFIEGRERGHCPECGFVHYINPLPSAAGVLVLEGKLLLIKRGVEPAKGHWALPSGFIESGETPKEGCVREVMEETGLRTSVEKLLDIFHIRSDIYGDVLIIAYLLNFEEGELAAGGDALEAAFFDCASLPDFHIEGFRRVVNRVLRKCENAPPHQSSHRTR